MDRAADLACLEDLNAAYLAAVQRGDVAWFDEHLAADFRCTNPDASFLDKAGFLRQTAAPVRIRNLRGHEVEIRLVGDTAVIHAATSYGSPDGSAGRGRYTDVWCRTGGRWLAVAAHVTRG
jgi:ketosteroid isomerase-like protein